MMDIKDLKNQVDLFLRRHWGTTLEDFADSAGLTGKWIPVSERLPDLKTEVIYSFDGIVSTGYIIDRDFNGEKTEPHWEDLESGATIEPIAWMPLPEPYKGGDSDG